jgi:hypothetical protein
VDERVSAWEDRLRGDLGRAVQDVTAREDLLGAVRAGGRRRVRRRRALASVPAAALVVGGAVWAGTRGSTPPPVVPATSTPSPEPTPSQTLSDAAAMDLFYATGYEYEDAYVLAELWQVDTVEAKAKGGRMIAAGEELPGADLGVAPGTP